MDFSDAFIRWTVRLALACYVAALLLLLDRRRSRGAKSIAAARWCWTVGCALLLLHVAAAFAFVHRWSHADAYQETARQTAAAIGVDWGGGVWFNYLFAVLWTADAAWWWLTGHERYTHRSRWITLSLHVYLAFIAVNATVVFETGWTRWFGLAGALTICVWAAIAVAASRPSV